MMPNKLHMHLGTHLWRRRFDSQRSAGYRRPARKCLGTASTNSGERSGTEGTTGRKTAAHMAPPLLRVEGQ